MLVKCKKLMILAYTVLLIYIFCGTYLEGQVVILNPEFHVFSALHSGIFWWGFFLLLFVVTGENKVLLVCDLDWSLTKYITVVICTLVL